VSSTGAAEVRLSGGVHLVLLPESQAEEVWLVDDPSLLLLTRADAFSDGNRWTLQSDGDPRFDFGIFGTASPEAGEAIQLAVERERDLFQRYHAALPALDLQARVTNIRPAAARTPWQFGPKVSWRPTSVPLAPDDADFAGAAIWRIEVPPIPSAATVSDVFLKIEYQGDVARLYRGQRLIDDNFWNGLPWTVGLKETIDDWRNAQPDLQLRVLPLPKRFPMYIEKAGELHFDSAGEAGLLTAVRLVPRYQLILKFPSRP
jgi:hypothetical protein